MNVAETGSLTYATTSTVLRPPRVALLFRGDEQWREWAKLALRTVSEAWGGLGFVLVPYAPHGAIDPRIAEAVAFYDPDHIITMRVHLSDWERIATDPLVIYGESGEPLKGTERAAAFARLIDQDQAIDDPVAEDARQNLSQLCTPMRDHLGDGTTHDLAISIQLGENSRALLTVAGIQNFKFSPCLAASPSWTSDTSLLASMRAGLIDDPSSESDHPDRPEPPREALLAWIIDPTGKPPPAELTWPTPGSGGMARRGCRRGCTHSIHIWTHSPAPSIAALAPSSSEMKPPTSPSR